MDQGFRFAKLAALALMAAVVASPLSRASADTVLSTWSDTPVRAAIIDFVSRVTNPTDPDFVPPEERVASFDMDGTVIT